jgi:uncharacterized protein YifE (UPF0438 family)
MVASNKAAGSFMAHHRTCLNKAQRKLLRKHYGVWRELDSGARAPANGTEEHFVAVCRGIAQPITEHEVTYAAFKAHLRTRGLTFDQVEVIGFEPIPDLFGQPSEAGPVDVHACPSSAEQFENGWQARAIEAYERDGKDTSGAPAGFIYRDNRYGNRRWNG